MLATSHLRLILTNVVVNRCPPFVARALLVDGGMIKTLLVGSAYCPRERVKIPSKRNGFLFSSHAVATSRCENSHQWIGWIFLFKNCSCVISDTSVDVSPSWVKSCMKIAYYYMYCIKAALLITETSRCYCKCVLLCYWYDIRYVGEISNLFLLETFYLFRGSQKY